MSITLSSARPAAKSNADLCSIRLKGLPRAALSKLFTTLTKPHTLRGTLNLVWSLCGIRTGSAYANFVTGSDGGWTAPKPARTTEIGADGLQAITASVSRTRARSGHLDPDPSS